MKILGNARWTRAQTFPGPPPKSSWFVEELALADGCGATPRIDIPKENVGGKILDAHLSLHFSSAFSHPHYTELTSNPLILQIHDTARLELSVDALQRGTTAADGSQACGLRERAGVGIHTPDLYREFDEYARLATAVHDGRHLSRGIFRMVGRGGRETQVTPVTRSQVT